MVTGALTWEEDQDGVLSADISDLDEAEMLALYMRFFGKRGIRIDNVGANNATYYKVLMASTKRGCRELRWHLREQARPPPRVRTRASERTRAFRRRASI